MFRTGGTVPSDRAWLQALCLAGWSTVAFPAAGNRTTVWRAGRGAGALAALFMLAAGRALPGCPELKMKKPADCQVAGLSRDLDGLSGRCISGRAAHQIGTHRAQ